MIPATLLGFVCGLAACTPIIRLQWRRIGRLGQRIHEQNDAAGRQAIEHGEEVNAYLEKLQIHVDEIARLMETNDALHDQLQGRAS